MTWRGSEEFQRERQEIFRLLKGMVRRLAITLAEGGIWQVLGQRGGAGGDETDDVELFGGIGFHSRPPSSGNPEAIALAVGGAKHQAIIATRDEATRQLVAGDLGEDSAAIFNSTAIVRIEGSSIEARSATGNAEPVLGLSDGTRIMSALATAIANETTAGHAVGAAALTAFQSALTATGFPSGTEIFKAE